jgi:hypothetical protein
MGTFTKIFVAYPKKMAEKIDYSKQDTNYEERMLIPH